MVNVDILRLSASFEDGKKVSAVGKRLVAIGLFYAGLAASGALVVLLVGEFARLSQRELVVFLSVLIGIITGLTLARASAIVEYGYPSALRTLLHRSSFDEKRTVEVEEFNTGRSSQFDRDELRQLLMKWELDFDARLSSNPAEFRAFWEQARKRSVLVVDDEPGANFILTKALRDFGFDVVSITVDRRENTIGLFADVARRRLYDVVLFDLIVANPPFDKFRKNLDTLDQAKVPVFLFARSLTKQDPATLKHFVRRWIPDTSGLVADYFSLTLLELIRTIFAAKTRLGGLPESQLDRPIDWPESRGRS